MRWASISAPGNPIMAAYARSLTAFCMSTSTPMPFSNISPRWYMALGSSSSAAIPSRRAPSCGSGSTPSPDATRIPSSLMAGTRPWSAAFLNHSAALDVSLGTLVP